MASLAHKPWIWLGGVLLLVAALYLPRLFGYWHSDDIAILHGLYVLQQQEKALQGLMAYFTGSMSSEGAFHRPLTMLSFALNHALAGQAYPAWIAVNIAVHLANVALIWLLLLRLARVSSSTSTARLGASVQGVDVATLLAATLVALLFGLSPLLAESVYWICARADALVTLCSLLALWAWLHPDPRKALWLLLLIPLGVAFKESGLVVPLMFAVLYLAMPQRRSAWHLSAALGSLLLLVGMLALRAWLFGQAWRVYLADESAPAGMGLWPDLASALPWWQGLSSATPLAAAVHGFVLLLVALLTLAALLGNEPGLRRMILGLAAAGAGMLLATLINLNSLLPNGEGGRLMYTALAWLALALGVALLKQPGSRYAMAVRAAALVISCVALISGTLVLYSLLARVDAAQTQMRALVTASAEWADRHDGLTLLLVADQQGPVVTARNAQGGLVLPPLQSEGLLHRILPTLPEELPLRHTQLQQGLASRLDALQPQYLDTELMVAMLELDQSLWPSHALCWSAFDSSLHSLQLPDPDLAEVWIASLREQARAACAIE